MPYKDPEKARANRRASYARNLERSRAQARKQYAATRERQLERAKKYRETHREKIAAYQRSNRERNRAATALCGMRTRAKKRGLAFDADLGAIETPDRCPICGVEMRRGSVADRRTSPSYDRIVPGLGYTKENVVIICTSCNTKKSDSTPEELYRIADFVWRVRKERGLDG